VPRSTGGSPPTRRVVALLELLAASAPLTASSAAQHLGLSGSTCAVVLAELAEAGFVERDDDKRYALGAGLLPLLRDVRRRFPLLGAAHEELERLSAATGARCTLTRIDVGALTVVAVSGQGKAGAQFPLDPPYGVVAHAFRPADEVERWLHGASLDLRARSRYHAVMAGIRDRGYTAWGQDPVAAPLVGEVRELLESLADTPEVGGLRDRLVEVFARLGGQGWTPAELDGGEPLSISYLLAPVLGPDGSPVYQVELHVLRERVSADDRGRLVASLLQAASAIERVVRD
jgi:DNA-binding IclR family transcriptional regulator